MIYRRRMMLVPFRPWNAASAASTAAHGYALVDSGTSVAGLLVAGSWNSINLLAADWGTCFQ